MKIQLPVCLISALLLGGAIDGFSQKEDDTYQVTGPVVELSDKKIVVQKGDERWAIARDGSTKVEGPLKLGSKVTVRYRMTATKIEATSYVDDKRTNIK
jgi:hypothetical protein